MITSRIRILRYRGTKMKRPATIILITVIVVSVFMACSTNGGSEDVSTTAVTDSQGQTYYYESAIDEDGKTVIDTNGNTVFVEIEMQSDGTAVTNKNSTYVTKEHTTVLPNKTNNHNQKNTDKSTIINTTIGLPTTNTTSVADNDILFGSEKMNTTSVSVPVQTTTSTTKESTSQPHTDSDGWIAKWY